jgi:hypothetical protein
VPIKTRYLSLSGVKVRGPTPEQAAALASRSELKEEAKTVLPHASSYIATVLRFLGVQKRPSYQRRQLGVRRTGGERLDRGRPRWRSERMRAAGATEGHGRVWQPLFVSIAADQSLMFQFTS